MYWNKNCVNIFSNGKKNCVNMCTKGRRREETFFWWSLGFNTLCRGCSSHTTLLDCCIPGKKSQRRSIEDLNFLIESKSCASIQLYYVISSNKYYPLFLIRFLLYYFNFHVFEPTIYICFWIFVNSWKTIIGFYLIEYANCSFFYCSIVLKNNWSLFGLFIYFFFWSNTFI